MRRVTRAELEGYLARDEITRLLDEHAMPGEEELLWQSWLRDSPPKRLVTALTYGDLLAGPRRTVLDVGGGVSTLTRLLADRHDYELVELLAHGAVELLDRWEQASHPFCHRVDWYEAPLRPAYDVIVANDLFPNVDQRLELFLERMLPKCRELRLSLTYYNTPRYYLTRRIGGDEILCFLAWSGSQTAAVLSHWASRIEGAEIGLLAEDAPSLFANGRQVCIVRMAGDLAEEGR